MSFPAAFTEATQSSLFFLSRAFILSFSRKDVADGLFTPKKLQLFSELRWTLLPWLGSCHISRKFTLLSLTSNGGSVSCVPELKGKFCLGEEKDFE